MRAVVIALASMVALGTRPVVADVGALRFGDGHALDGWKAVPATGFAIEGSELVQHATGRFSRDLPLDARGWVVEARFAIELDGSSVEIDVTDDRLSARFSRTAGVARLDGESFELPDPSGMHTFRIEASTGRRLLLVDGQVVIDHDTAMPNLTLDPRPSITFGAVVKGGNGQPPAHWASLSIDTAPTGLATSSVAYAPAIAFTGPFAPWFFRYASRAQQIAHALAELTLPERARACVAFDIVASGSTPRPRHLRIAELAKAPKQGPREIEPQIDFDLLEDRIAPSRQARKPMRRSNRVPAQVRAQDQLRAALAAKDPEPFYERAINITVAEAPLPTEALAWLVAQLAELAKHPDACR